MRYLGKMDKEAIVMRFLAVDDMDSSIFNGYQERDVSYDLNYQIGSGKTGNWVLWHVWRIRNE